MLVVCELWKEKKKQQQQQLITGSSFKLTFRFQVNFFKTLWFNTCSMSQCRACVLLVAKVCDRTKTKQGNIYSYNSWTCLCQVINKCVQRANSSRQISRAQGEFEAAWDFWVFGARRGGSGGWRGGEMKSNGGMKGGEWLPQWQCNPPG